MPNWCENRVNICCDDDDPDHIKQYQELVAKFKSNTPFNEIFPQPDWKNTPNEDGELPVEKPIHGCKISKFPKSGKTDERWYHWRCENWGTKWDINTDELDILYEDDDSIKLLFNTAWGPPEGIHDKIITDLDFISVSWFYDEPGMQIAGYLK